MQSRHAVLDPANNHSLFRQQTEAIERLIRNIEEFPTAPADPGNQSPYLVNQVTSLLGERGTGKTTILIRAREKMRDRGWAVTELLIPDVLHNQDAVGPAIFDRIYRSLESMADTEEERKSIQSQLDPLKRDLAWFYNAIVPNDIVARDSVSIADYAKNVFNYHISGMQLPAMFSGVVEKCMDDLGIERLVLFVDDADIKIELVETVLDAVRYIVSSPRIATVFSADLYTLRRRMLNMRLKLLQIEKLPESQGFRLFGASGEAYKAREIEAERDYVDAFLMKLLPPATRVPLHATPAAELLAHEVTVAGQGISAVRMLTAITIEDNRSGHQVSLGDLAARYPNVFDTNLRAFVNQHSQINSILENFVNRNASFFQLTEAEMDEMIPVTGNMLSMDGRLTRLTEAALVRILRVFTEAPAHKDWLDTLAYFGILDIASENRVGRILDSVISRMNSIGSTMDTLRFSIATSKDDRIDLDKREQVHILHLIIDLAIVFGADVYHLFRLLNITYHEAFRHFYVTKGLFKFFESKQDLLKISVVSGSNEPGIYGSIVATRDTDSAAPVYLSAAADMALYTHFAIGGSDGANVRDKNEKFGAILRDKKSELETRRQAEENQFYNIIFNMMDVVADQLISCQGVVYDIQPSQLSAPELSYTINSQSNWGIVTPLRGWSYLARLFNGVSGPAPQWDRPFLILLIAAQLPYPAFFACFSAAQAETGARNAVRQKLAEMREFLEERGFVSDGKFVNDERFREILAGADDMPRTSRAVTYWPTQNYQQRGDSLLELLKFAQQDGIDLGERANLRNEPPPIWRKWKDELIELRQSMSPEDWGLQSFDDSNDD